MTSILFIQYVVLFSVLAKLQLLPPTDQLMVPFRIVSNSPCCQGIRICAHQPSLRITSYCFQLPPCQVVHPSCPLRAEPHFDAKAQHSLGSWAMLGRSCRSTGAGLEAARHSCPFRGQKNPNEITFN